MTKKPAKKQKIKKAVAKSYEPTEREQLALRTYDSRRENAAPFQPLKVEMKNKKAMLSFDHSDQSTGQRLLMEMVGTTRADFLDGFIKEIVQASQKGQNPDQDRVNYFLSIVAGIEPRDQMEAMLAAQMATVHSQMMVFARRMNHVENIPQQDSAERAFNKLARTFTTQMEALNRYRGKGQQKMTVEHVNVHEGGQAIVGTVQGGEDGKKKQ